DGVPEPQLFASHVDRDLAREVAARDGRGDVGDVSDLSGEVRGHRVDVVGEILPGAGHSRYERLTTELALGADLACHAADLGREAIELVHHRVDGVFELQNLSLHVDGDLARQVDSRNAAFHTRQLSDPS